MADSPRSWHEIARPQVHGYDLQDASFISTLRLITASDEKVARVFDAPAGFVRLLKGLGAVKDDLDEVTFNGPTTPFNGYSKLFIRNHDHWERLFRLSVYPTKLLPT